jgi:cytochrome c556
MAARFSTVTAAGRVTTLSDPRFAAENAKAGVRSLPTLTQHQLLFSFEKGGGSFGKSSDQVVTVASELRAEAQVFLRVNKLLDGVTPVSLYLAARPSQP